MPSRHINWSKVPPARSVFGSRKHFSFALAKKENGHAMININLISIGMFALLVNTAALLAT
jgi:hypothetical protein